LTVQYGDNCLVRTKVYEYVERFEGGRTSVVDAGCGRPSTVTCVEVKHQIDRRIRDNRRISTDKTISEMSISHGKKQYKNVVQGSSENILF
jgi:hypothetical protein